MNWPKDSPYSQRSYTVRVRVSREFEVKVPLGRAKSLSEAAEWAKGLVGKRKEKLVKVTAYPEWNEWGDDDSDD